MKKFILMGICSMVLAAPAFAASAKVKVNGMVCSFCAQGIKKSFAKEEAVKKVDVSLEKKFVDLEFKEGKSLPDAEITKIITEAGYNVEKIERKK
jgi:periplasmic mercuric ion binding protein